MKVDPKKAALAGIILGALILIGIGAWMVYRPLGPLTVGFLIWLDVFLWKRGGKSK